jgi:hypothetical protein
VTTAGSAHGLLSTCRTPPANPANAPHCLPSTKWHRQTADCPPAPSRCSRPSRKMALKPPPLRVRQHPSAQSSSPSTTLIRTPRQWESLKCRQRLRQAWPAGPLPQGSGLLWGATPGEEATHLLTFKTILYGSVIDFACLVKRKLYSLV